MKKVIVTTTINQPTEAILRFDAMKDWTLVVIGDKKTPPYRLDRGIYVTPDEQEKYDASLSEAIGWNCIQRRNFGLLWSYDLAQMLSRSSMTTTFRNRVGARILLSGATWRSIFLRPTCRRSIR